ncbi:hypothetical protein EDC01DRAFT_634318 [Geopyxis carbonaria]|nr:hypothetical protein EDC01DRAFT_634318 [Geopyxis carbonaria]
MAFTMPHALPKPALAAPDKPAYPLPFGILGFGLHLGSDRGDTPDLRDRDRGVQPPAVCCGDLHTDAYTDAVPRNAPMEPQQPPHPVRADHTHSGAYTARPLYGVYDALRARRLGRAVPARSSLRDLCARRAAGACARRGVSARCEMGGRRSGSGVWDRCGAGCWDCGLHGKAAGGALGSGYGVGVGWECGDRGAIGGGFGSYGAGEEVRMEGFAGGRGAVEVVGEGGGWGGGVGCDVILWLLSWIFAVWLLIKICLLVLLCGNLQLYFWMEGENRLAETIVLRF